jgi:hypothetical protein
MPAAPIPVGQGSPGTRAHQVAVIAADLDTFYPNSGAGNNYRAFAAAHPKLGAMQAAQTWAGSAFAKGLQKAFGITIGAALKAIEASTVGAAQGVAKASQAIDPANFLGILTEASTWKRVAEFAIGAILLAVAVAKLAENTPAGAKLASGLKKAAIL